MGWLSGILSGYVDRQHEITDEAAKADLANQKREGDIYSSLLEHKDPEVRQMAATGILQLGQGRKRKTGLSGWMGEMQSSPVYQTLGKYMTTPHDYEEPETVPQLRTHSTTGYLSTPPGVTPSMAQPTTSPTQGGPMAQPQQLPPEQASAAVPPPPPPFNYEALGETEAPPPGGPPPPPSTSLAENAEGQQSFTEAPVSVTPPPTPPASMLRTQDSPAFGQPVDTVQRMHTVNRLPGMPSAADHAANIKAADIRGEVTELQEQHRLLGDPDWQKKGIADYLAQHGKSAMPFRVVNVEYTDPKTGKIVEDFGLVNQQTGQLFSQDGITPLPADARPVIKAAQERVISAGDRAARALNKGYTREAEVPPGDQAALLAEMNRQAGETARVKTTETNEAKYTTEQKRIKPWAVTNAAKQILRDATSATVVLNGRSQAFKDAVGNEVAAAGVPINKITDGARQAAELAKIVLPKMDNIADMAIELGRRNMLGPMEGRWSEFLNGTIGSGDVNGRTPQDAQLFATFKSEVDLLQKAVNKVHLGMRGAGSPYVLEESDRVLSAKRMDAGTFLASMKGLRDWMESYSDVLPDWGTPGREQDEDAPQAAPQTTPQAPPQVTPPVTPQAPPQAAPKTLSPQYKAQQPYDPATNKSRSTAPLKYDAGTGAATR
jgi:hypothetical protein